MSCAALVVGGCVAHPIGPARTFGSFQGKAVTSAESVLSAVQTVRLLASASSDGHTFGPYTSVSVSEQEDAASGVEGTFASIQPPDDRAVELRDELSAILTTAVDHIADVRIEVRRGHLDELATAAEPLAADASKLQEFIEANS